MHVHLVVVESGFNNTISDRLCNDLLCFLNRFKAQFLLNILKVDLTVRNIKLFETELDYGVLEAVDEGCVFISSENFCILLEKLFEFVHLALLHTIHDLQVGSQMVLKVLILEKRSVGNFTHQQLDDHQQLLCLHSKTKCTVFGTFPECLNQTSLRCRILQLDSFDPSNIVKVSGGLTITGILGESSLSDKITSLFIQVLLQVATDNNVHHHSLA